MKKVIQVTNKEQLNLTFVQRFRAESFQGELKLENTAAHELDNNTARPCCPQPRALSLSRLFFFPPLRPAEGGRDDVLSPRSAFFPSPRAPGKSSRSSRRCSRRRGSSRRGAGIRSTQSVGRWVSYRALERASSGEKFTCSLLELKRRRGCCRMKDCRVLFSFLKLRDSGVFLLRFIVRLLAQK